MSRYGGEKRMSRLKGGAGEPLWRGRRVRACVRARVHKRIGHRMSRLQT